MNFVALRTTLPPSREREGDRGRERVRRRADIIGSNASRQTIREISYRLVAALAPLVTAYSWNARPL